MPHLPTSGCKAFESLVRTDSISLGVYRCEHRNVDRGGDQLADCYSLNFPTRGVYRRHSPKGDTLVDLQRCVWFDAGTTYQTSHPQGFGDAGFYLTFGRATARELIAEFDPAAADSDRHAFRCADGPLGPRDLLEVQRIYRDATIGADSPLASEERAFALARTLLERSLRDRLPRRRRERPDAKRRRREIAFAAAGVLAARTEQPLTLAALAHELGVSAFHLSRVFHAEMNVTLRDFHEQARLRAACLRIIAGANDLTRVAFDFGFASHSHFTSRFRRVFGATPSSLRAEFATAPRLP